MDGRIDGWVDGGRKSEMKERKKRGKGGEGWMRRLRVKYRFKSSMFTLRTAKSRSPGTHQSKFKNDYYDEGR